MTLHSALRPQMPGRQGLAHLWSMQAKFWLHSELTRHSGRQLGGSPIYSGRHEQIHWSFLSLWVLYGPHGLGSHGSETIGSTKDGKNSMFLKSLIS